MPTALASQPTRATSSITLSWALVNIPLSVYASTEKIGVPRSQFRHNTDHPVGNKSYDKVTGEVIENKGDVVYKAQASDGTWVVLEDDEVMAITHPAVKCEVVTFVPLAAIGTAYLPEAYYQVRPKRDADANVQQGYSLLLTAMARRQVAALIKIAMRGPARFAAILPDGRMVTLHYADGIRESLPMPQVELPEAVIAYADQMIDLVGESLPTLADTNGPAVQAFVDAKAKGLNPDPTPTPERPSAQSLLDSLMASIEASKPSKAKAPRKAKAKAAA